MILPSLFKGLGLHALSALIPDLCQLGHSS